MNAINKGLIKETDVSNALTGTLRIQMKLGFYDDNKLNPYSIYGADTVHNKYHVALSRKMSQQSLVLLKKMVFCHCKKKSILLYW